MIDDKILKYLKKLYLLHGNEWFGDTFICNIDSNPFYEEFEKFSWSSRSFKFLFDEEYIVGNVLEDFWGSDKYKFTTKFVDFCSNDLT